MGNAQKTEKELVQELKAVYQRLTELESTEEALRESEEKFASIFRHSPMGLSLARLSDGVIIEINDSYTTFTGYTREEVIGRKVTELNIWVNPEDRERMMKMMKDKGRVTNEEFYFHVKSGGIHPVLVSAENVNIGGEDYLLVMASDITERKQAEEALQESEEKFRNLFEHAKDAVILADAATGLLVDINPAGCAMLGLPKEKIIGMHQTALHPPEMAEKYQQIFREHVERKIVLSDETILLRADGTPIQVDMSASVITLGNKTIMQGVFRDITERKQAEEELRESEEFTSTLLTNTSNAIFVTYADGTIKYVNPAFETLTGFSLAEIIGMKIPYPWWPKDNKDEIEASLMETTSSEGINLGERLAKQMTFQKKNGELFIVDLNATIINKNGKREYILVTWIDITERKQAEKALQESEEKFAKAFSASGNAICITSLKDNRFIEANESFTRFTGYSHQEVIGRDAAELKLWVKPEELKQWMDTIQKEGQVFNQEFSSRRKSGEIRIGLSSAEVINIGGEPCRIVVITDITERKKAEEGLRQTMANLEQSSARLAAANKELEAFSYSVSHDLRSPLRSIDGFSQALLEDYTDKLDATAQDYLKRLRNASQKMGELIDGLLKLSRLTRSEIHRENVDLSALADEIATRLHETNPERKVEFITGGGLTAYGDPQLLRALLENLLGNAWKFTGKVPLAKIEFGAIQNGGPRTFFVKDNGAGFDMTYVDKLFGAFQRLHDIAEFPGTGIGLATVQRIINRHGGTVRAEGEVGKGAAFYFTLD